MQARSECPVFVLGCARSGTTLLYHMLLSAGDFAIHRAETHAFDTLIPRFGSLRRPRDKQRFWEAWRTSRSFQVSGLSEVEVRTKILARCRNGAEVLGEFMERIAERQNVRRWAECTPAHVLHIPEIKRAFPGALVIHIIRDGRDVAVSVNRLGWVRPLPWDRQQSLLVAGLSWEWLVQRGRRDGERLGGDYIEVRYEDLVQSPRETLSRLGYFIEHDLDYGRIQEVGIGSVSKPNTAFPGEVGPGKPGPIGRWERTMSSDDLAQFEAAVGQFLEELGYRRATDSQEVARPAALRRMRRLYRLYFSAKQWAKTNTPLSRLLVGTEVLRD